MHMPTTKNEHTLTAQCSINTSLNAAPGCSKLHITINYNINHMFCNKQLSCLKLATKSHIKQMHVVSTNSWQLTAVGKSNQKVGFANS